MASFSLLRTSPIWVRSNKHQFVLSAQSKTDLTASKMLDHSSQAEAMAAVATVARPVSPPQDRRARTPSDTERALLAEIDRTLAELYEPSVVFGENTLCSSVGPRVSLVPLGTKMFVGR